MKSAALLFHDRFMAIGAAVGQANIAAALSTITITEEVQAALKRRQAQGQAALFALDREGKAHLWPSADNDKAKWHMKPIKKFLKQHALSPAEGKAAAKKQRKESAKKKTQKKKDKKTATTKKQDDEDGQMAHDEL